MTRIDPRLIPRTSAWAMPAPSAIVPGSEVPPLPQASRPPFFLPKGIGIPVVGTLPPVVVPPGPTPTLLTILIDGVLTLLVDQSGAVIVQ